MITDPEGTVLALFATFCRIGGCFMVLPGISTARVSLRIRLFLSIAISIAIIPLMWEPIYAATRVSNSAYVVLVASETFIGVTLGLIARYITLGLQFSGAALSASIGFNAAPTSAILQNEPQGAITNLITVTAIVLLFISDFHHMVIQTIVNSYKFMPIGTGFEVRMALVTLTDTLSETFLLMLRLASPFIVYGLIFNLAIGMVNKLAPQIPIYFISIPFILAGGLLLVYFGIANYLTLFLDGFIQIFQG
ncbi:MAG: flagellar biosynthetic protein FliR [Lentilitoribacter sp.]